MAESSTSFTPRLEGAFILSCLRAAVSAGHDDDLARDLPSADEVDWTRLQTLARAHHIRPAVCRYLQKLPVGIVPAEVGRAMDSDLRDLAFNQMAMCAELRRLLVHFDDAGIDSIPLKGPVLGEVLLGSPVAREYEDLDFLLRETDIQRARSLLVDMGYTHDLQLTDAQEKRYMRSGNHFVFSHNDTGSLVELHWALNRRSAAVHLDAADVWSRHTSVRVFGMDVNSVSEEDLMLHLCMHGSRHHWCRLQWLLDLAMLLEKRPHIDWDLVMSRADTAGCTRMVMLGLYLANHVLGATIPHPIGESVSSDAAVPDLADTVLSDLFHAGHETWSVTRSLAFHVKVRERWRDRFAVAFRMFCTPTVSDWAAFPQMASWPSLYYFTRPVRLAAKAASRYLFPVAEPESQSGHEEDSQISV